MQLLQLGVSNFRCNTSPWNARQSKVMTIGTSTTTVMTTTSLVPYVLSTVMQDNTIGSVLVATKLGVLMPGSFIRPKETWSPKSSAGQGHSNCKHLIVEGTVPLADLEVRLRQRCD